MSKPISFTARASELRAADSEEVVAHQGMDADQQERDDLTSLKAAAWDDACGIEPPY